MTKTRQDNNVIDRTSVISTKYDNKLSRPIRHFAIYKEDETGYWRD